MLFIYIPLADCRLFMLPLIINKSLFVRYFRETLPVKA